MIALGVTPVESLDNGSLSVQAPHFRSSRTLLMGILNVTPDSFSDGGQFLEPGRAVERGLRMVDEGADFIDIGGESSRPGACPVSESEELQRVTPVIRALVRQCDVPISIDTQKPGVARLCTDLGASIINDVGGLRDPAMAEVAAAAAAGVVIMHMRGSPATMQRDTAYQNVVDEIRGYLRSAASAAERAGVPDGASELPDPRSPGRDHQLGVPSADRSVPQVLLGKPAEPLGDRRAPRGHTRGRGRGRNEWRWHRACPRRHCLSPRLGNRGCCQEGDRCAISC